MPSTSAMDRAVPAVATTLSALKLPQHSSRGMKKLMDEDDISPPSFKEECCASLSMAMPLAASNLVERASVWVTWVLVGQVGGADRLGPASLASTVNNVLGVSVNIGLSLAVSTLAAQASGAGDSQGLSRSLQRALPVAVVFSLPVIALLLLLSPLLRLLHVSDAFAATAGQFALCLLPVAPLTGMQRSMNAWLAAQKITRPLLAINLLLTPLHAACAVALVHHTRLGYLGAGVAMSALAAARAGSTYLYVCCSPRCRHAWGGFRPSVAFAGWRAHLALALPGVLMLCEFWVGELLIFSASLLAAPAVALAALAIYQLTNGTSYQFPSGVRVAVSSRVGRALGAAQPRAAALVVRAGVAIVVGWIALPATVLLTATRQWGELFVSHSAAHSAHDLGSAHEARSAHATVDLLVELAPWLVAYVSLDALLAVGAGALTGCGRQGLGGRLAVLSYACVGLPVALLLAFGASWGAVGLAAGHTLGKALMTAVVFHVVASTDWHAESAKAAARTSGTHTAEDTAGGHPPAGGDPSAAILAPVDAQMPARDLEDASVADDAPPATDRALES